MRLWSLHPQYLDQKGLVALWREGLLAKKVLEGKTKGYKNHPQLQRFKDSPHTLHDINAYLTLVYQEAKSRGYNFQSAKIRLKKIKKQIVISEGQLAHEFQHLLSKLIIRDKTQHQSLKNVKSIKAAPIFKIVKGAKADWEKV